MRPPWGLLWRDSTPEEKGQGAPRRVLDLDPVAAPFVRTMFAKALAGESVRAIAAWVRALPERDRRSRVFNFSAVRRALVAPVYVGRPTVNDESMSHGDVLALPAGR
jgi:hypothetical protein